MTFNWAVYWTICLKHNGGAININQLLDVTKAISNRGWNFSSLLYFFVREVTKQEYLTRKSWIYNANTLKQTNKKTKSTERILEI